jgi:hypothetical protein
MKKKPKSFLTFESFRDKITVISSILLIFGMLFAAWMFLDNRYAQKKVEQKLDYVKYSLQFQMNNDKISTLMSLYPKIETADPVVKQQLQTYMDTKLELVRKMEVLEKLGIGL